MKQNEFLPAVMTKIKTLPKISNVSVRAESDLFKIESVDLNFSNGIFRTYERFAGTRNAVMVIPRLDDDTLLFVKEYAVGTEKYEITFPKGVIDSGESFVEAANREMKEEIGYGAKTFYLMKELTSSPGYACGKMQMLLAEDLYKDTLEGDEPEPIEVIECKIKNIDEFILREDFTESRSVAGLLMLSRMLNGSDYKLEKLA